MYGLKQLLSFLLERDHTEGPLRFAIQKLVPLLLRTMKKTMAAQQMRQNRSRQSRAVISEEYVESAGLLGVQTNEVGVTVLELDKPYGDGKVDSTGEIYTVDHFLASGTDDYAVLEALENGLAPNKPEIDVKIVGAGFKTACFRRN